VPEDLPAPASFDQVQQDYWRNQKHRKRRDPDHPVVRAFVLPKIKAIRSVVDLPARPSILDVGAGNGYFSAWWGKEGNVTAVDYSPVILEGNPVAKKMVMDARNLRFPAGSFDLSFCHAVLHHIPRQDRVTVVREMARVSKQYVAVIEPNRYNPLMLAFSLLKKEERGGLAFSRSYTCSLLEQAGLRVIYSCSWGALTPNRMPFAQLLLPLFAALERPLPLGVANIVVAERVS
jgi:SAM-dependent methyltransferase